MIVDDHGLHRFVFIDEGTYPATETGVSTTGGGGIYNEGAFVVGGGSSIESKEFVVALAPRVFGFVEVEPDFVVFPVFDGGYR